MFLWDGAYHSKHIVDEEYKVLLKKGFVNVLLIC